MVQVLLDAFLREMPNASIVESTTHRRVKFKFEADETEFADAQFRKLFRLRKVYFASLVDSLYPVGEDIILICPLCHSVRIEFMCKGCY